MSKAADIPEIVMEDAIGWFDDLRGNPRVDNEAFATWLLRSPTHVEAFLSIATLHGGLTAASPSNRAWLESLVAEAQGNVLPLESSRDERPLPAADTSRQWLRLGIAASVLLMVLAGLLFGVWSVDNRDQADRYATTVGEQRTLVLDDGSLLQLNTNTSVTVHFSDEARSIVLLGGEAMFKVKKDPARPFTVQSGQVSVVAIGTRFNVYRQAEETRVTVIEGRVAVGAPEVQNGNPTKDHDGKRAASPQGTSNDTASENIVTAPVELTAGEQLAIRPDGTIAGQAAVNTERTVAWTQRRVMFDNDTLGTVASEFNRYNRDKLIIDDETLQQRRISGVFTVSDPQSFAEVLASMTPIRSEKRADGSVRIVRAEPPAEPALR